jgi:mono/diheme cytochrome c family protein
MSAAIMTAAMKKILQRSLGSVCCCVFMILMTHRAAVTQVDNAAVSVYSELSKAPKKAVARHNLLEKDAEAVSGGAKLFALHCAECHGESAEGGKSRKKGPSLRAVEVQQAAPGALFWVLTNGVVRRGMPVWSKLPEPQRWQLVSYIKSLGPSTPSRAEDQPTP